MKMIIMFLMPFIVLFSLRGIFMFLNNLIDNGE